MNDYLNQRQEAFCNNILLGKSATESAKIAGYSEKTAQEQSSRLLSNVIICQRIATLQQAVTTGNIATVTERKELLTSIAKDKHKLPLTAKERVLAISELNKMGGDYAPERRDHTFNGEGLAEVLLKLRGYNPPKQLEEGD